MNYVQLKLIKLSCRRPGPMFGRAQRLNICLGRQAPVHLNTHYFQVYAIHVVIYLSEHLSFQELIETIDA